MQVYGPRETGMHWQLHKTGRRHMRRYQELGQKRMPVSVALGGDPILPYAATAPLPDGIDEFMFAGFLRRKPVEMVRCKTNDLEVPASADFVLEGYVDVDEPLRREGPFGDHTGYYSLADDYPTFHLTAITRRENPIYATTVVGPPPQEDAWLGKATERLFLPLLQMTFPEIIDMNLPIEGCFHNLCIVSIHKEYPHHARKICHSLWGMGQMMFAKCIIVVDDDVNVQNVAEVAWRALNNIDAKRDVFFAEGPIDVLDHASQAFGFGGKLGVDATRKWKDEGFTREWPEVLKMRPDVVARVDALWKDLGL
jgi:4-hydroxy-3-polyprenylbenzoate decarboxylase